MGPDHSEFPSDFKALFHQAPAGYLITSTDGTILEVNDTFLTWTGLDRASVQDQNLLTLLPVGDKLMYATHAQPLLEAHGAYDELTMDFIGTGGNRLPAMCSASRAAPARGTSAVDRIVVLCSTGRRNYELQLEAALRKAEEAENARLQAEANTAAHQDALGEKEADLRVALQQSRRSESLLKTILNTVDVGIAVVDDGGNAFIKNPRYQDTVDRATGDGSSGGSESQIFVYGPDRTTRVPPCDNPRLRAARGESFSEQILWIGRPGNQRALSASAQKVTEIEDFAGSVIVYNDVTELINAMAAKKDFVANVSHELRTPLTSIMGYLDLVLDDPNLPEHTTASLNVAMRNCERLLQLVGDLLSTATAGSALKPRPTDLVELILTSITSAALRAEINNVSLAAEIPSSLLAEVDPLRISQVFDNLLSNAIKFSPDGGQVIVNAREARGKIIVEVSDTGIGMTPTEAQQAFTKFFRVGTVIKAAIPGAGLGLAISKNIVEAHHGTITITSERERGTTMTITLPCRS